MPDDITPFDFADDADELPKVRRDKRPKDESRRKKSKTKARDLFDEMVLDRKPNSAVKNQPSALWALVVVVPLIGLAVFMAVRQARNRSAEQSAFASEMDKLLAPPGVGPVNATPGKVAIIDVDKRALHHLHDRNDGEGADKQAATPAETAIVVQLRVTNREVLEYLNGRKGVKQTFHLTVIDKATWTKIDERSFEGGDPPDSISLRRSGGTNEPVTGSVPAKEIYAYLRTLGGG